MGERRRTQMKRPIRRKKRNRRREMWQAIGEEQSRIKRGRMWKTEMRTMERTMRER